MKKIYKMLWLLALLAVMPVANVVAQNVAKIGDTGYATLADAVAAVPTDGTATTITMAANTTETAGIVVATGQNVVIDLKGKNITGSVNGKLITNNGTLTIKGTGCVYNQDISAQGHDAVYNTGTLVINGGIFGDKNSTKTDANDVNRGAAVRNYGGTATINGGSFTACDNYTNNGYAYALINDNNGTMTINNATVYGKNNGNIANNNGSVTVKGGTYTLDGDKSYYSLYVDGEDGMATTIVKGGTFNNTTNNGLIRTDDATNASVEIEGGSFTYTKLSNQTGTDLKLEVSGGSFSTDVTDYVESGSDVYNGGGNYVINPVAQIGENKYESLAAAVAAVPTDGTATTITIIANQTINVVGYAITIPATKNVVLDLNGFQVVGTVEQEGTSALIRNLGTLTIMDSSDTEKDGTGTGKLMSGANPTWTWDGTDDYSGSYASNLIRNEKNLTVESGLLYNMSTGSASYAIDNYSAGNVTINGGKVDAAKASAIRLFYIDGGSITVTDGVIGHYTSDTDRSFMGVQVMGGTNANVSIEGGTLAGKNAFYASNSGGTMSITGGTFNGAVGSSNITGFISNGTFEDPVLRELCVQGKKCVEDNGKYIIVDNSDERESASINTVYYYWLNSDNSKGGGYYDFYAPFEGPDPVLMDGEFVELKDDVKLTKDVTYLTECSFGDPIYKGGTFTLTFGEYNIDLNGFKFPIPAGVTVKTDKQTDIFSAAEGYKIVETAVEGGYSYTVTELPSVAKIGETKYATLEAAFAAATDGATITLLANCAGNGIKVAQGKFANGLTVDFGGFTYTMDGEMVGSTGTETQAFQLLKDNTITFKNGTIASTKAKILVQNYSNLTLDGMTLTLNNPNYASAYTLSNNNGNTVINSTTINANPAGGFAFDVCRFSSYPSVGVTVTGESKINGNVEISASKGDAKNGFGLTLTSGTMTGNIVVDATAKAAMESTPEKVTVTKANTFEQAAPAGYKWVADGENTSKLVVDEFILRDGTAYTKTADEQVAKATYIRSFGSDRVKKYQGWFIPFDYTITAADLQKFKFFKIDMIAHSAVPGEAGDPNKLWVHLIQLKEGDVMKANMPYIFTPQEEAQNYEFTTTNATLKALTTQSVASCSTTSEEFNFYGVYSPIHPQEENTDIFYYMAMSGQLSYATKTSTTVGANRWIFRVTPKSGQESKVAYSIGFVVNGEVEDDDVTAVSSAAAEAESEVVGYYTLSGQKVSEPTKGVYVVKYANGTSKKVVF